MDQPQLWVLTVETEQGALGPASDYFYTSLHATREDAMGHILDVAHGADVLGLYEFERASAKQDPDTPAPLDVDDFLAWVADQDITFNWQVVARPLPGAVTVVTDAQAEAAGMLLDIAMDSGGETADDAGPVARALGEARLIVVVPDAEEDQ